MNPIDKFGLDKNSQSGLSKLYVVEKLISHYGGDNCFIDGNGNVSQSLEIGAGLVVDPTPTVATVNLTIDAGLTGSVPWVDENNPAREQFVLLLGSGTAETRIPGHEYSDFGDLNVVAVAWDSSHGLWFVYSPADDEFGNLLTSETALDERDTLLWRIDHATNEVTPLSTQSPINGIQAGFESTDSVLTYKSSSTGRLSGGTTVTVVD